MVFPFYIWLVLFAAFAAFAVCVALPLCAAELTHRWSFNGDWSDSAGGVDAVKCGATKTLYVGKSTGLMLIFM